MAQVKTDLVISTAYFPNTAYLRALTSAGNVTIDLGEHFIKQTCRNRAYVLGSNGVQKLIVPLNKWKNNTAVRDIRISYTENWQKLHWKTLEAAYRSSPFFEYYEYKLSELIHAKHHFLKDLNDSILRFILETWQISLEVKYSENYIENTEGVSDKRQYENEVTQSGETYKTYIQVFGREKFFGNLSFIDLICNEGPKALHLL